VPGLSELTVDEEWRRLERRSAARQRWIRIVAYRASRAGGSAELAYTLGGGGAALVSRDPSKPGGWRCTRFDAQGPSGHIEAPDLETAIKYAHEDGYRRWEPGAVGRALVGGGG
jgi:hypothetical protein